ncbi:glycoside hydrolase family 35 protein [Pseudalkalibacillus decolorationis]|uniref:glycoside hydrolase family 35 protein n=1 Tax=Pseudalkalibacillus decolorationis TaxID=163879 RepID=UPI002147E27B|nr:beta-galactosidase family protein [Pseudalkalibacillus decolorationis]
MGDLKVSNGELLLDEKPIQLISGAIHYFRMVPEQWKDRLEKLKACGFNCVEFYIPWNLHEPRPGEYNFEGIANVKKFIELADELGLLVIVRPSPYICAEWEFGGLPSWLLKDENIRLRSSDPSFLKYVDRYLKEILGVLKPFLSTNGGPIIAMQIENEYGSYGTDQNYLKHLRDVMIDNGMDVLLFTSDGPIDFMLQGGTIDGTLATVNLGSKSDQAFEKLEKFYPNSPKICMEYWNGWFDHWGEEHHTRDYTDAAETFKHMLESGVSVNFYMFYGGTNFGFYNGANFSDHYQPTITSYDYDAPLTEAGDYTEKYHAIRKIIANHTKKELPPLPKESPKKSYGKVELNKSISLFDALPVLSKAVHSPDPLPMEKVGQDYGFILYRKFLKGPRDNMILNLQEVRDRALIFLDSKYQGVIDRWEESTVAFSVPKEGVQLDILVENLGRINYGPQLKDPKGITEGIRHGQQFLHNWDIYPLPLDNLTDLLFADNDLAQGPAFFKGHFQVDEPCDTFLALPGWKKGVVFINDFNIGRYWEKGPQETYYVPASLLKKGENELKIFEVHESKNKEVDFVDKPKLG